MKLCAAEASLDDKIAVSKAFSSSIGTKGIAFIIHILSNSWIALLENIHRQSKLIDNKFQNTPIFGFLSIIIHSKRFVN